MFVDPDDDNCCSRWGRPPDLRITVMVCILGSRLTWWSDCVSTKKRLTCDMRESDNKRSSSEIWLTNSFALLSHPSPLCARFSCNRADIVYRSVQRMWVQPTWLAVRFARTRTRTWVAFKIINSISHLSITNPQQIMRPFLYLCI